jgi:hypothetical protein
MTANPAPENQSAAASTQDVRGSGLSVTPGSASEATACTFQIAATAHGCNQVGVDHWQDWKTTKVFSGAATIAMLDAWAKASMGPKAAWNDLILSPVEPNNRDEQRDERSRDNHGRAT